MDKKVKKIDRAKIIKKSAEELLFLMGSKAEVEVAKDKENDAFLVNLVTTDETGLLIGRHGETILSIQAVLGMIVKRKLGEWVRLILNVGDWREREEIHLKELASQTAARAKETEEPQALYNLTPAQRRVIHLFLSADPEIETESQGEGKERFLTVRKK